jgi:predicted N-acetyltransferase YhbS
VALEIAALKSRPEHLQTVARWIYDEWEHVTERDLGAVVARIAARMNDDRIPLTLVALSGGECVGTVGLWEGDLLSRPDLTPWLAALYVAPAHRGRGVGGALIDAVLATARRLGVSRLYLHTETASGYYRGKGWRSLFCSVNDRNEETEVFDFVLD